MLSADESFEALCLSVGERIKALRAKAGMSQRELSRLSGMKHNYLWRVEAGQQNLSLRTLMRLAIALDVPLTAFFHGIELDAAPLPARPYTRKLPASAEEPDQ